MAGIPPKTVEERLGIVEEGRKDCMKIQDERHTETMDRMKRIEGWYVWILGLGAVTLLAVLFGIIADFMKK